MAVTNQLGKAQENVIINLKRRQIYMAMLAIVLTVSFLTQFFLLPKIEKWQEEISLYQIKLDEIKRVSVLWDDPAHRAEMDKMKQNIVIDVTPDSSNIIMNFIKKQYLMSRISFPGASLAFSDDGIQGTLEGNATLASAFNLINTFENQSWVVSYSLVPKVEENQSFTSITPSQSVLPTKTSSQSDMYTMQISIKIPIVKKENQ